MEEKRFVVRMRKDPATEVPQELHHRHVERLAALKAQGIVRHNGPVAGGAGGIIVLDVPDMAAAERVVSEDPLVIHGFETPEIWEWTKRA